MKNHQRQAVLGSIEEYLAYLEYAVPQQRGKNRAQRVALDAFKMACL